MDMNRKFKQGWSTIPPISTKQTTTSRSYLKSLHTHNTNNNKHNIMIKYDIWRWTSILV
jgi:hypothetical protein